MNKHDTLSVVIKHEFPMERLCALLGSAIEGGDPVTTASKGGWCAGVLWEGDSDVLPSKEPWYWNKANFIHCDGFRLRVIEVDDDADSEGIDHFLTRESVIAGLAEMAQKFPAQFKQVVDDEIDGPCADAFLQACVFGHEKYA